MNVKENGVFGDGVTDDTQALQQLINSSKGELFLPPGIYKVSQLTTHGHIHLVGAGAMCTTIKSISPAGDVLTLEGPDNQIRDLGFDSLVPRTGGSYVNFGPISSNSRLSNFFMRHAYRGVSASGPISTYIDHGLIRDTVFAGVVIEGGQDHYLQYLTMDNEPEAQPVSGIAISATGNTNISDCDIIHCGWGLSITGGYSIYVRDCFFDTAIGGILIEPVTGIERCHFHGCWTCSHSGHGVLISPVGEGVAGTIDFVGHHSMFNQADGMHLGQGRDIKVAASSCDDNGLSGIAVGSDATIISSSSMRHNKFGCYMLPAAMRTSIVGNIMDGNREANIVGSSTIFANNFQ